MQRIAERWRRAAAGSLAEVGFDASLIERQFARQATIEALPEGDFAFYSQPTEAAMGAVFAHTAILQQKPHNKNALFEIGRSFGGIMLLLDAYQDFERDTRTGCFNALAAAYPGADPRTSAQALFSQYHRTLRNACTHLELPQPGLLQNLLVRQLGRIGCHSLNLCQSPRRGNSQ